MRFLVRKGRHKPGENMLGSQNRISVKPVSRNSEKTSRNSMVLGCVLARRVLEMCLQNSAKHSRIFTVLRSREKSQRKNVPEKGSRTLVLCVFRDMGPFGRSRGAPSGRKTHFPGGKLKAFRGRETRKSRKSIVTKPVEIKGAFGGGGSKNL